MTINFNSGALSPGILRTGEQTSTQTKKVRFSDQVTQVAIPRLGKRALDANSVERAKKPRIEQINLTGEELKDKLNTCEIINRLLMQEYKKLEVDLMQNYILFTNFVELNQAEQYENGLLNKYSEISQQESPQNLKELCSQILANNYYLNSLVMIELARIPQSQSANFYGQILIDEVENKLLFRVLNFPTSNHSLTQELSQNLEIFEESENKLNIYEKNNALLKQKNKEITNKLRVYQSKKTELMESCTILNKKNQELREQIQVNLKTNELSYRQSLSQALNTCHHLSMRMAILRNAVYHLTYPTLQI